MERVFEAFGEDMRAVPKMTLRAGDAVDVYQPSCPFDASMDAVTDDYLEKYFCGLTYLDAQSWRHYLPCFMAYALKTLETPFNASDALLASLRPPDREPPRLSSLTAQQEGVVIEFLEIMAFDPKSASQDLACQVMEEWWIPGAVYRPSNAQQTVPADRPKAGSG
jgi:hypothetical protein